MQLLHVESKQTHQYLQQPAVFLVRAEIPIALVEGPAILPTHGLAHDVRQDSHDHIHKTNACADKERPEGVVEWWNARERGERVSSPGLEAQRGGSHVRRGRTGPR